MDCIVKQFLLVIDVNLLIEWVVYRLIYQLNNFLIIYILFTYYKKQYVIPELEPVNKLVLFIQVLYPVSSI